MGGLDWIPIICKSIGRNDPGRRYVVNRLPVLRSALKDWAEAQKAYRNMMEQQETSPVLRRKLETFTTLVSKEMDLLNSAVSYIELWCRGGCDSSLNQAKKAYAQAQLLWKRRLALVRDIMP